MLFDRALCRGARAIAGLSQAELAAAAGVGLSTISQFEAGRRAPHPHNRDAIKRALAAIGVEFAEHPDGAACIRLDPKRFYSLQTNEVLPE